MTEGFKAYIIPADKREEYFTFIEHLYTAQPREMTSGYDGYSDPIVKFRDVTTFSMKNQIALEFNMKRIGAKDITEDYIEN